MRILVWHGWLLDGSGSNVFTAQLARAFKGQGHDVVVLCQERTPEDLNWVDAYGVVGNEIGPIVERTPTDGGRCTLLRPEIGPILPVFVYDEYEGFEVQRFVDLSEDVLESYLETNSVALRAAATWHRPDVVITGHAVPGAEIARRALDDGTYVAMVHGSDILYAIEEQSRYRQMAETGLKGARCVTGTSGDVLRRIQDIIPSVAAMDTMVVHPGVDIERFHLRDQREALRTAARLLREDGDVGGRHGLDDAVKAALRDRDAAELDTLADTYDQNVPDTSAASTFETLAGRPEGPLIGYIGKLIPPKGVERFVDSLALLPGTTGLAIGFGSFREWLSALIDALDRGDIDAYGWLRDARPDWGLDLRADEVQGADGLRERLRFVGKLDHRFAPAALSGLDILHVPSTGAEAFGMVAAEGASSGALPVVARQTGLAEVADALESAVGRPELFSYEPGDTHRAAAAIQRLLDLPAGERETLRADLSDFVAQTWTWDAAARRLIAAGA